MGSKKTGGCGDGTTAVAVLRLAASKLQARQQKIGRSNSKFHALAHQVKHPGFQVPVALSGPAEGPSRQRSQTLAALQVQ